MQIIKSITEIKKNIHKAADGCRRNESPVYVTKNGKINLVIMSLEHYERLIAKNDLYEN